LERGLKSPRYKLTSRHLGHLERSAFSVASRLEVGTRAEKPALQTDTRAHLGHPRRSAYC
jgi:hypothetical protein